MKEHRVVGHAKRAPTHPGEVLREDVLPSLHLSISEAARQLRVTRQTLHRILAGRAAVTPEMAVRLGKFCDTQEAALANAKEAMRLRIDTATEFGDPIPGPNGPTHVIAARAVSW